MPFTVFSDTSSEKLSDQKFEQKLETLWDKTAKTFYSPKTNIFYTRSIDKIPGPELINEYKPLKKNGDPNYMGGGTGTGSAHYVATIAKEQLRALTIGVVTFPFKAEGTVRAENALRGLDKLSRICDTTIVIPNDKLLELVPKLPVDAAFKVADEVLMQTIKGLTEIITKPGLVNLDYADIQTVMREGGVAFVGIGEADTEEEDRVSVAVQEALMSPLLGEINLKEAKGALIRVVGGPDMTINEAQRAAEIVTESVSDRARIIWGCSVDPEFEGTIKVLLIVTGASSKYVYGRNNGESTKVGGSFGDEYRQSRKLGGDNNSRQPSRPSQPSMYDDDGIDIIL